MTTTNPATSIKVMTFNVRYGHDDDGPNAWPLRRELVLDVIRRSECEVLGLQEVTPEQLFFLREALPQYDFLFRARSSKPDRDEATPLLVARDRWDVDPEDRGTWWLSETPETPGSTSWGNPPPRIFTWARVVEKATGRGLYVYNTHLDYHSENSRRKSVVLIARHVAGRSYGEPVVLLGDFNAEENEYPIQYLQGRAGQTPAVFIDTFRQRHPHEPAAATRGGFAGVLCGPKIDYVFALPEMPVLAAAILRNHYNGRYPSDHYPVVAELGLPGDLPQMMHQ